jgi:hypothetical protein
MPNEDSRLPFWAGARQRINMASGKLCISPVEGSRND